MTAKYCEVETKRGNPKNYIFRKFKGKKMCGSLKIDCSFIHSIKNLNYFAGGPTNFNYATDAFVFL